MRARPTLLLARTFFARMFESDLMPPGLPQVQLVIWSMAFLAMPGLLMPARFASHYTQIEHNPQALARAFPAHRLLFVTLTMTALGLVALAIWDGMFPDRRDARILGPLPVSGRVQIVARLLALSALAGIFLAGVNLVPTVLYAPIAAAFGAASSIVRGTFAHLVATTLAGLFVFCSLIALQGIVLNLGGRRIADRIAIVLQIVFVVGLLQMIFFLPTVASMLQVDAGHMWSNPWLRAMPSVWFLAVYDVLDGIPAPGAGSLAAFGAIATAVVGFAASGLFAATYGRLTRLALESREANGSGGLAGRARAALAGRICPRPVTRAVFEFTLRTLLRSRSHRLLLSMYVGVALALICSAIVPLAIRRGLAGFAEPALEILSAPLVISCLSLIGIRVALAIPVEPKANWSVRLAEPMDRIGAMNGVRAAMLVAGVLPAAIVAAVSAGALWGPWIGFWHALICTLMGWLLVEILLVRLEKIPFACTYFPGRSRISTLWPLYLTGFITYSYTVAAWESEVFARPRSLAIACTLIVGAIVILTIRRRQLLSGLLGFRYVEEDPTTLFAGFQLSEGLAATAHDVRRLR